MQHLLIVSLSSGCGICYCKGAYPSVIATNVLGGRRSSFSVIDGWQATILAVKGRMLLFFIPMEGATEFLWHFFCFLCRGVRRHKPYSAPIVLHPTGKEKKNPSGDFMESPEGLEYAVKPCVFGSGGDEGCLIPPRCPASPRGRRLLR